MAVKHGTYIYTHTHTHTYIYIYINKSEIRETAEYTFKKAEQNKYQMSGPHGHDCCVFA